MTAASIPPSSSEELLLPALPGEGAADEPPSGGGAPAGEFAAAPLAAVERVAGCGFPTPAAPGDSPPAEGAAEPSPLTPDAAALLGALGAGLLLRSPRGSRPGITWVILGIPSPH